MGRNGRAWMTKDGLHLSQIHLSDTIVLGDVTLYPALTEAIVKIKPLKSCGTKKCMGSKSSSFLPRFLISHHAALLIACEKAENVMSCHPLDASLSSFGIDMHGCFGNRAAASSMNLGMG
nr:hypothetical protein CFP56_28864 [Quercus suber]